LSGAIVAFAFLHALLYSSLLPLWEGFDEAYHYGYVQDLALRRELPALERSTLNEEIWRSMQLAPASHLVARNTAGLTSYTDYFQLPESERRRRRDELARLASPLRAIRAGGRNYEAQQAPLAYLPLAAMEWMQRAAALPNRVWRLRVLASAASVALLAWATMRLGARLGLAPGYAGAALLLLFSTQNLYAAVAHVANDWLAVPLIALLLLAADAFRSAPGRRSAAIFALTLAAGLLAKSYFLVFIPCALALVWWYGRRHTPLFAALMLALAGPWYARNLALYGNLSGLQPAVAAIPRAAIVESIQSVNWPAALVGMARGALWNANNSFTTYSARTLNVVIALLAAGLFLLARRGRERAGRPAALVVLAGSAVFAVVPIYALALFGAQSGAAYPNANSWYSAGLLPGVYLLACAGFAAAGRVGRWLLRGLLALAAFVLAATYFAKLIPLYSGYDGAVRLSRLAELYGPLRGELFARLDQAALAPAGFVFALAAATAGCGAVLAWRTGRALE
jgi:hypothetical protein